jgi:hypothetical protein
MKVKIDLIAWDKKKVLSKELENWNYTAQVSLDWLLEKGCGRWGPLAFTQTCRHFDEENM